LIVAHHDVGHKTGHIWRDVNDIGADAAIARPRFIHVVNPQIASDQECCHDGNGCDSEAAKECECGFHGRNSEDK